MCNQSSHGNDLHTSPVASATKSSQSTQRDNSQGNNPIYPLHCLSAEQLQQFAHALSMMRPNNTNGNSNAFANVASLSIFSNVSVNLVFTKPWILDSRATYHITLDSTLFTYLESSSAPIINSPTGSSFVITSSGNIPFNFDNTLMFCVCLCSI